MQPPADDKDKIIAELRAELQATQSVLEEYRAEYVRVKTTVQGIAFKF